MRGEAGPPATLETASVGGIRTVWRRAGSGPPLLLLHHAGGSSRRWRRVLPSLARRRTVLAPDLPGHGGSDEPAGSAWEAWVGFLPSFLDAIPPAGPPDVVAHSLSGLAVTAALATRRLALRRLVLVAPPAGRELPAPIRVSRSGAAGRAVTWKAFRDAVRRRMAHDPSRVPEEDWAAVHEDFSDPKVQRTLRTLLADYPRLEDLPASAPPAEGCLVLWGEEDRMVPPSQLSRWLDALPWARGETIPASGHFPMLEAPEDFAGRVDAFLAG